MRYLFDIPIAQIAPINNIIHLLIEIPVHMNGRLLVATCNLVLLILHTYRQVGYHHTVPSTVHITHYSITVTV